MPASSIAPAAMAVGIRTLVEARQTPAANAGGISKTTLKCADGLAGLTFTDHEGKLMLGLMKGNREFIDALRKFRCGFSYKQ